jgi:hypothetical protein
MDSALFCARCAIELSPGDGSFYVVRIDAVADPTGPIVEKVPSSKELRREIRKVIKQLNEVSAQEGMNQVHRRLTLHLCAKCYPEWIENPAGG